MFRIASIVSFALSIVFYAWDIGHAPWTWVLFMLIGLLCLAIG